MFEGSQAEGVGGWGGGVGRPSDRGGGVPQRGGGSATVV